MKKAKVVHELLKRVPGTFSNELGIDLGSKKKEELFKWFLASLLFGARIGETIAISTYGKFDEQSIDSPKKIIDMGWDGIVKLLDEGGYVRYDFKTATKLLDIASLVEKEYQGDLENLHRKAKTPEDLENLLHGFKGVGPITINIFLRELRGIWKKAAPLPGDPALIASLDLGLINKQEAVDRRISLSRLQNSWTEAKIKNKNFPDFEATLVRLGKNYCRRNKEACPLKEYHIS